MADKKVCKVCFSVLEEKDEKCPVCAFPTQAPHFTEKTQCEEWDKDKVIPYRNQYLKRKMKRLPEYQEMLRRREAKKQEEEKKSQWQNSCYES